MTFPFGNNQYRIVPDRDEWVAPEETLLDAGSSVGDIEVPVGDGVFRHAWVVITLSTLILVGALVHLTLQRHAALKELADRNRTVTVSVPPPRGLILDRNGNALVQNEPSFDLLVIGKQVRSAPDGSPLGLTALAPVLGMNPEELALALADGLKKNSVFFLATDLNRNQVLTLNDILPPGFFIITSTKRIYSNSVQFAPLIGYVGKVNTDDMATDTYYVPSDTAGRLGIEEQYETTLRGVHGSLVFDAGVSKVEAPTPGNNVVLSVDSDIQKHLYNSVLTILRSAGLSAAAAVVQDPRDGSVLGLVSFPSYDNNMFSSQLSQTDFDQLFLGKSRPLFNRVIAGLYNPGSTIKPFFGMAGLQEGLVTPHQTLVDGCVDLSVPNSKDPEHPYVFKNWRPDSGPFDLDRAIAQSCNIYFFTLGGGQGSFAGLGADRIDSYLKKGLADTILNIDLPGEQPGFVPTPDWKLATKGVPWFLGDTYNTSIGQGDLLVTPLWINLYVSAIANGGAMWQPRVVTRIVDDNRSTVASLPAVQIGTLPFSASVVRDMQVAMQGTVATGTAKLLQDVGVPIAAKTGTSEVIKGSRINALLTLYAPADNPQIAMTVLFEGSSSNQGYALHAADDFLKWYFSVAH